MLSKRQCPYTGITNFFSDAEPYMPVGAIYSSVAKPGFLWRCHAGDDGAAGRTTDLKTAEARLFRYYQDHSDEPDAAYLTRSTH